MNTNQKSIAVLSSPYLFAISQVGAAFAALASYPARNFVPAVLANAPLLELSRDGLHSKRRADKGRRFCTILVPSNRINRAARRRMAKVA